MKSLRNIAIAVALGVFMFGGTIYLAQFGRGAAILFNMVSYGIICAVIARTKNRNSFGWFFVGFFLSLVGVALALAKAPNSALTEKAT